MTSRVSCPWKHQQFQQDGPSTLITHIYREIRVNSCRQHTVKFRGVAAVSRRFGNCMTLTIAAAMFVLLSGASLAPAQSAVPLLNAPLAPEQKTPGSAAFTLTVYGTGFASGAVVNWNGTPLTTTFVTSSELTAAVPATNAAAAATALVTVSNGGVISNANYFQVVKNGYTPA